ncbi:MAG TPA: SIR2 family protein, partial [Myxococcota bacterium]|nr:SIR2 family protein [Myxococcota bacterium]
MAPRTWAETGLVDHFRRLHDYMADRKFCFVLGAGASYRSGIPVGGQFVSRWLRELWGQEGHGQSFEDWATADNLQIPGFTVADAASFYPQVFVRRFGGDPQEGYAWLEGQMGQARPSFGYFVLARILTQTRHNIVITTNFDNLVAEALAMSGGGHPLVVGHESLAGFVSSSPRRAVIAKIHRDLLLAPVNDPHGTSHLPDDWATALRRILGAYTPLFIGYGGNDGSLMGFLDSLPPRHIPGQPVWCYWYRYAPAPHIVALMEKHNGVLVPIRDFDELMMRLNDSLGFGLPIEPVTKRANEMIDRCRVETEAVLRRLQESAGEAPEARPAAEPTESSASLLAARGSIERTDEPWAVVLRARMTLDPERRRAVFNDGMRRFPGNAPLRAEYARFLADALREVPAAEALLREALPEPLAN